MSTHHRNEYLNEYLPRIADGQLTDALRTSGAVLIQGPKWCGKTATGSRAAPSNIHLQDPDQSTAYLTLWRFLHLKLFKFYALIHALDT